MQKKHTSTEWEWCQYYDDEPSGMFTVRKTVKTDYAKFYSKGEALAFIAEQERLAKNGGKS